MTFICVIIFYRNAAHDNFLNVCEGQKSAQLKKNSRRIGRFGIHCKNVFGQVGQSLAKVLTLY